VLRIWSLLNHGRLGATVSATAALCLALSSCTGHGGHASHTAREAAATVACFTPIPPRPETGGFTVYTKGNGPGVLILHELPGLTVEDLHLANRIAEAGYTVYVPLLFGQAGKSQTFRNIFRACFGGGFHCFSSRDPGPILARLRVLAKYVRAQRGERIGVIGLCFTGSLPIALLADPGVAAPVLAEPSLPLLAWTEKAKSSLGISPCDVKSAKSKGVPIRAFRFNNDTISPRQRSRTLRKEFGGQIEVVEIDSSPANLNGFTEKAHAVLTVEFADYPGDPTKAALDEILAFFDKQLR
jgi:dienelactone hydrolase